ncbi:hypothetical protein BH11BAC6_BH11BAC6_08630 [soil metagenome]
MKGLVLVLSTFLFSACLKSNDSTACKDVTPESEQSSLNSISLANGMTPQIDSTGLYYQILSPGILPKPDLNDSVAVIYEGRFPDGSIFSPAQSTPTPLTPLGLFIEGWGIGIEKIGKGGQIKLVIPSSLAYGCTGYSSIPPNTILYFNITLVDVKPAP